MVLSTQSPSTNQVVGEIASPKGEALRKVQSPGIQDNNNLDFLEDKENGPRAPVYPLETMEETQMIREDDSMENEEGEEEVSAASPKRLAEEISQGSPESNTKKARTNDFDEIQATASKEASPPRTSGSSRSIDDLLADLAKAKSALMQSKDTLMLLKEHQEKLAENGASMGARVEAFDKELTKLKDTHTQNGKELEKMLSIRDSANKTFQAAEETLKKIRNSSSSVDERESVAHGDETTTIEEDSNAADSKDAASPTAKTDLVAEEIVEETVVTSDVAEEDLQLNSDEVDAEKEMAETENVEPSIAEPSVEKEDTADAEDMEAEAATVEDKDMSEDKEEVEQEEVELASPSKATEPEVEAKDMPSPSGSEKEDYASPTEVEAAEAALDEVAEDSNAETSFDEDEAEIEEAKEALSFLDGSADSADESASENSASGLEMSNEVKSCAGSVQVKASLSTAARIDDTLALELQNSDGGDSDDDLLM